MEVVFLLLLVVITVYLFIISAEEKIPIIERIVSLFLSFLFLYLAVSLATYKPDNEIANYGGKLGHILSETLVKNVGFVVSFYFSTAFSIFSFLLFMRRGRKSFIIELLALLILIMSVTLYLPQPLSGKTQSGLSAFLLKNLGLAGKILFSLFLIILSALTLKIPNLLRLFKGKREKEEVSPKAYDLEKDEEDYEKDVEIANRNDKKKTTYRPSRALKASFSEEDFQPEKLIQFLKVPESTDYSESKQELEKNKSLIEEKLKEFGIDGKVINYFPGPVVTRYEYEPAPGIRLSKISSLSDDIALKMRSNYIRIVAPLPNKGLVGFEIPNKNRKTVYLRSLVERDEFLNLESPLAFALGVDTAGNPVYADLAQMPHLLIAGSTGSGKSVCINTIITSIIFRNTPQKVRFILIDPKRIELSLYEGIPHLLLPVVKERKLAVEVLKKAVKWMEYRYTLLAKEATRDIESYNKKMKSEGLETMPHIVIIIDEFADLILTTGREVEEPIARLAQMARAVGIHLVVATQRPSVDVITGTIKANFPVRIAFKVPSRVDSKTILDEIGAEKLLGKGDMLFIPPGSSEKVRLHGPLITENETKEISRALIQHYLKQKIQSSLEIEKQQSNKLVEELIDQNLYIPFMRIDEPGLDELEARLTEYLADTVDLDYEVVKEQICEIRENYYSKIPEMTDIPLEQIEEETQIEEGEWDPMLEEAAKVVILEGKASATLLQRKLKLGFARAARVIDQLEKIGVIGPQEGTKPRKVLVKMEDLDNIFRN